jgi:mono/diheme cytochrome c family protein
MTAVISAAVGEDLAPAAPIDRQAAKGGDVYKSGRCFACHGELGGGGLGPSLAGDPMLAIGQFVIARIIIGRGAMPPFGEKLSNAEIAAVAQHIRNSWGNDFGAVTPQEVEETRQLMKHAGEVAQRVSTSEK